jgi:hypothetical protein
MTWEEGAHGGWCETALGCGGPEEVWDVGGPLRVGRYLTGSGVQPQLLAQADVGGWAYASEMSAMAFTPVPVSV